MPTAFTPLHALLGGALIGVAATVLYAGMGRIAGISGLLNALLDRTSDGAWRVAFLVSLVVGAAAWFVFGHGVAAPRAEFPRIWLVVAGLLVGFGTRLGNGCTSGHGICGLARLSKRSMVAVMVFMGSAALTVFVVRHVVGMDW
ncbi:MAG: YeeE/YedE family protein [Lysobacteraceae bacterium]|nr:MAG: YeeE/YedE family protein [Xanthomonadaceae bacterium]